jgi:hypothetical protein
MNIDFDKILSNVKDYHLPIIVFIFLIGTLLQRFGHMDTTFVEFTTVIVAGVTGQAFSPARKDSGSQPQ